MIGSVDSFKRFVHVDETNLFTSCITAMERGLLHVDVTNQCGETLGVLFVLNQRWFDPVLWDKYWTLGPDVATFWSGIPTCLLPKEAESLRNTPALWADLALVRRFAKKYSWLEGEVRSRIRASLRLAWIAAVVSR